jgi:mannose-6-phosphate isomerase class I
VNIAEKMRELSSQIQSGSISLENARKEAAEFIKLKNPWQYVNRFEMKQYDLLDLSRGGVHHSWEEYKEKYPLGNIVYEVQLDVMDENCTIRSFDQGKIKDDGTIREIHIDDYFQFLDSSEDANDIKKLTRTGEGERLLQTSYYSLDRLEVQSSKRQVITDSFEHVFIQSGEVTVSTNDVSLTVPEGHSCFIPYGVGEYTIEPKRNSVVLKTYISAQ